MKKLFFTFCLALLTSSVFAQVSAREKQALLDIYVLTDGENWTNSWDINLPVAEWNGVSITDNKVTGISLLFNNIQGSIPNSIGDLTNLVTLELAFNNINGEIPSTIGNLTKLEVLSFNGNFLSGNIPESIGNLSALKELHLSSNLLTGAMPASLASLKDMAVLNVFDNKLSGELPSKLANHRNLRELIIAKNNFQDTEMFSTILLRNSGSQLDLSLPIMMPPAKTVIAIETSDDDN
ncbi:MAG: hypothetical protein ACI86C_000847 [Candidatus Latescibacterota bacterium]|jgi:hypothetical protein